MNENKVQTIVEKVKELVQRGNVSRIVVRKGERVLLDIPVNVGIVGGVVARSPPPSGCCSQAFSLRSASAAALRSLRRTETSSTSWTRRTPGASAPPRRARSLP